MANGEDSNAELNKISDSEKENTVLDPPIPGGETQSEPNEESSDEDSANNNDTMGCTTSTKAKDAMDTENQPVENSNQRKIDDYFSPQGKKGPTNRKSSPMQMDVDSDGDHARNRPQSSGSRRKFSDDDDDESSKRSSSRGTRASRPLSPIRMKFEDSDDDEDSRFVSYSKQDILEYRNHYPRAKSNKALKDNVQFYKNSMPSYPDGDYIDNIHKQWRDDYRKLEFHHGFIQWLFPLQEQGLNWSAQPLQKHEIEAIKSDPKALKRLLESYRMMLGFYGFELVDEQSGQIRRLRGDNYKSRFRNLNTSSHNYLRITRILKCLGEFDYEHLKFPFLERVLYESIIENTLPNCLRSCKDYWIETLRDQGERRAIRMYARELIEYRNKGVSPPKCHRAQRPAPKSPMNKSSGASSRPRGGSAGNLNS
ncbi:unnamed protein product [Adineta ricciae]|uniref:Opioid growth factor receptor (OGFr) conserved domain-containing protein n=1 Tax=Adineta ricciae TaxID=249248 RepID=A0A814BLD1_ADIRI|nr:unnamed protein product [Adineta ricciae]CAF0928186.1 unnamed protein product [Adineta ricciae]